MTLRTIQTTALALTCVGLASGAANGSAQQNESLAATVATPKREGGPPVLQLPASTAAHSLGTAFMLSRGSTDVIFYNPSLIESANGFGVGWARFGESTTLTTFSATMPWAGGEIGVGLQSLGYDTDARTIARLTKGSLELLEDGSVGASDLVLTGAYARELLGVEWGVGAKLVEQRLDGVHAREAAVDVGASVDLGRLTVGLTAQNLGPEVELNGTGLNLAERFTLGAAGHGAWVGPFDLGGAAALSVEADGSVVPAAGFEVAWWPVIGRTFVARVGARRVVDSPEDEITWGFAFIGDDLTIDYAFQGFDGYDALHRIGVSWR